MAITFIAAGSKGEATNADIIVPTPAGIQVGDLLLILATVRSNGGTWGTPSGWTDRFNVQHSGAGPRLRLLWKIAGASESNVTITYTGSAGHTHIGQMCAFRGVNQTTPFAEDGATSENASAQDIGPISGINIADGNAVVVMGAKRDNRTSVATLSGDSLTWAEIGDIDSNLGTQGLEVWDYAISAGGTTVTSKTFVVTGGTAIEGIGKMTELAAASGVGTEQFNLSSGALLRISGLTKDVLAGAKLAVPAQLDMLSGVNLGGMVVTVVTRSLEGGLRTLVKDRRVYRYAACWEITRRDGVVLRLTDHNAPLQVVEDVAGVQVLATYNPMSSIQASAREAKDSLRGSNLEVAGVISADVVTEDDLRAGRYHDAEIRELLVDWRFPWVGVIKQKVYRVQDIVRTGEVWEAQIASLSELLGLPVGDVLTPHCGHLFGDAGCGFDREDGVTVAGIPVKRTGAVVISADSRRRFIATHPTIQDPSNFEYFFGEVLWETGLNAGLRGEIAEAGFPAQSHAEFTLRLRQPFNITPGDTFTVYLGCDLTSFMCINSFDNILNFDGYEDIPGSDVMQQL